MDTIATYSDSSGQYTITRDGDTLTTTITSGDYVETFSHSLTRHPFYDGPHSDDMLSDRFASDCEFGSHGMVWIDRAAYALGVSL